MKKYILSIMAMALCLLSANAQTVSVSNVTLAAGETKVVSINLSNWQSNIVSFQMDLTLPEGITLNKAGCELSNRFTDENQELTIGKQPNGDYRSTSTSFALKPISGTSGEIIKLSLTAAKDAKGGTASLKNIILATSDSQTLTANNITFKVDVSYTLTYKVDGEVYKTASVAYGTSITPEAALTKEGHTFSGWSEIPKTMPNHDVEVTGSFSINSYTLTYLLDGEVYKTESIVYGSPIEPEPALKKTGYTFSGWSEIPATMPAHDVTVTGSFSINSYTLTYKVDGEVYKTMTVVYGTAITPEKEPTKEGYTFSGWSEIPKTMPAHDVVVTGSFSINSYTLTYMLNGEVYKTESIVYGTAITPEPALSKEGYIFSGWSEIPKTMPAHDVTVTGSFSINSYTLTYMVDGEVYKSMTVVYGTAITPEKEPTKEGYTFSGWSEIPATMPANDVVVTGSFSINSYTLTYMLDGEVYKTESIVYGTAITPEPAPIKEGHTFSGWTGLPATMPAHDVTVIGSFNINSYTLTFMVDGKVYASYSLVYGSTLPSVTAPTKEGHTFVGWGGLPTTMPAHDVMVQAQWIINQYQLTYIVDGKVYKSYEIDYHAAITPEPAPVRKGMTFSGWSTLPEIMPARDITISGTFTWTKKTISYVIYQVTDTLNNYVSVVGNNISSYSNVEAEILSSVEIEGESYKVNRIENSTFYNCYSLTSIIISKSVTSIGETAFQDCTGLTSVTIGNSVASIGRDAFRGCTNLKKTIWLTNTPPSGYESVKSSINYVSNEQYVKLSNTIVYPFLSSLFEIDGICYIPVNPSERTCNAIDCRHNEKVANMDIASTVSYKGITMHVQIVQPYFCYNNQYIQTLNCDNEDIISEYAFSGCTNLTSVICNNNGEIGPNAFNGCTNLTSFICNNNGEIGPNAFNGCKNLTSVVCNNDGNIGSNAFSGCKNLTSVECNNDGGIGSNAFNGCTNLNSLTLGEEVSLIGDYSFQGCSSLQSVTIPDSVSALGNYAFSGCSSLASVRLGNNIKSLGSYVFQDCGIPAISIPASVNSIRDYAFTGCTKLKTVIIANRDNELSLGSNGSSPLFTSCPLDSVYIGGNISYNTSSSYGYSPFYRNTSLRTVVITDKETEISPNEFYGCTNLQNVAIGDGVTSFGDWAFSGCTSLNRLSFGSHLASIGKEAFYDCNSVTQIVSKAVTPPSCGTQALDDINKWECTLTVPERSLASYQQADQWKEFFFIEGRNFDDGIGNVKSEIAQEEDYYDLQGRKIAEPQKGINIIRYSDGSTRKVMVK